MDIWAVGVIVAEMFLRRPLLPGRSFTHQLQLTLEVLGAPEDKELEWLRPLPAFRNVRAQAAAARCKLQSGVGAGGAPGAAPPPPLSSAVMLARLLPAGTDADALDLINKMLAFDPAKRISVEAALAHPWVADYHDPSDEPTGAPPPATMFAFDLRDTIPRGELATLMLAEASRYPGAHAPGGEGAGVAAVPGAGLPPRPTSTRMRSHAAALPPAASGSEPKQRAPAEPAVPSAGAADGIISAISAQLSAMRADILQVRRAAFILLWLERGHVGVLHFSSLQHHKSFEPFFSPLLPQVVESKVGDLAERMTALEESRGRRSAMEVSPEGSKGGVEDSSIVMS